MNAKASRRRPGFLPGWRRPASAVAIAFPQGRFQWGATGAASVTEEHLPGPQNGRFAVGRSPTSPTYLFLYVGEGMLCWDLVDMQGLIRYRAVS